MTYLQLEKVKMRCKKMTFCHQKDWVNTITSVCSSRISVAVFSAQQCYSECASCHCCADILLMNLSWDAYISYTQYSSSSCFVSAFCFSRASMSMMLFTVFVTLFTDLALTNLIFKISSDEFVNLLTFKIVLMNSI